MQPPTVHQPHAHLRTEGPAVTARRRVVLAGNPNVGKSVIFNYLSGLYVDVSNYPGTTVEVSHARYLENDLFDTPGIYGVSSFNDEERVARDIILNADIVVNVADAVHLERDLFLTQQLIDMGKRVLLVVNMVDEARRRHLDIDVASLERELGIPVLATVATRRDGLDRLHEAIETAREGVQDPRLHARLHLALASVGSQAEALLVLEGDAVVAERHGVPAGDEAMREEIYIDRRNRVNAIVGRAVRDAQVRTRLSAFVGRLAVSPVYGFPILAVVLYALYIFVGVFVAQDVVGYTEETLGQRYVEFHIKSFVARHASVTATVDYASGAPLREEVRFPSGTDAARGQWSDLRHRAADRDGLFGFTFGNVWLTLLFGEFGAVTMTLTYLLFLLLPLVLGFYFALSVLEDSGYLPRLATLVDRALRLLGLNGRAVIPLILGFGCVTMATITTRLLETQREKTIATTILQLAIPCSAQLGVIAALLATAGPQATLVYTAVILAILIVVGTVMNRALDGGPSPLLLDLPAMRLPQWSNVLKKTGYKTWFFMKEASPWFFIGALVVGVLQATGALLLIQNAARPLVTGWLRLPAEAATAFVMGLVRRDFGAAGLYDMTLSPYQTVAALVTITLFVPCVASLMVMLKERGMREGLTIWLGSLALALFVGGLVAQALV